MNKLIPNIDYIINTNGDLVFTKTYLLKRGHCCQSGCLNCPYGHSEKADPNVPAEFKDAWGDQDLIHDYFDEDENEEDKEDDE